MDQISEGGRSIHEIDKIRKRLEAEKMELQAALEEAEGALEQEENKVLRAQLELTQVRQEIERRIAEKEEEFLTTRKNFQKAIDGMQVALETEAKGKAEALRLKKMFLSLTWPWSMPMLLIKIPKKPSRNTINKSEKLKLSLRRNKETRKLFVMLSLQMSAEQILLKMLLRRLAPCLSKLIVLVAQLSRSFLIPMSNSLT